MKPLPQTRSVANRPLAPIKLARMRLRTFRPDSSTHRSGHSKTGHMDCLVYITVPLIEALSKPCPQHLNVARAAR